MTREEAINKWIIPAIRNTWNDKKCEEILKALKQEPCEDCISRQAAIDCITYDEEYTIECLKALPPAVPQSNMGWWIPVSEKLPEDSGEYFVTVINENIETYKYTEIAWYAHPKDYDIEEGDWRELKFDEKVIAWMPLPPSYDPQESEVEK